MTVWERGGGGLCMRVTVLFVHCVDWTMLVPYIVSWCPHIVSLLVHLIIVFLTSVMLYFVYPSSHQSGEVAMESFCRMESVACRLPSMLSALEEYDFLFQLQLSDMPQDDSKEVCECVRSPSSPIKVPPPGCGVYVNVFFLS